MNVENNNSANIDVQAADSKDWIDVYEDEGLFIAKIQALLRIIVSSSVDAGPESLAEVDIEYCLYLCVDLMEDLKSKHADLHVKVCNAIKPKTDDADHVARELDRH